MLASGLLIVACIGATSDASSARADYELARANAGRDVATHVRLALWCERRGMEAEKARHLGIALLLDPREPTARGLSGRMLEGDRWGTPRRGRRVDPGRVGDGGAARPISGSQGGGGRIGRGPVGHGPVGRRARPED